MSEPRFYVTELVGYPIEATPRVGGQQSQASYYVYDRLYNCALVAIYENGPGLANFSRARLRRRAEREAERLNEWWKWELRRG